MPAWPPAADPARRHGGATWPTRRSRRGSGPGSSTTGSSSARSSAPRTGSSCSRATWSSRSRRTVRHATAIQLTAEALRSAFGPAFHLRVQAPIALDAQSEPEPDVCVVPGAPHGYRDAHPERPALIAEVALSRLAFDRERKGGLYARAAIAEYWIVNIVDRRLEVYRDPAPDAAAAFGWRYATLLSLGPADRIEALAAPGTAVLVADLLP